MLKRTWLPVLLLGFVSIFAVQEIMAQQQAQLPSSGCSSCQKGAQAQAQGMPSLATVPGAVSPEAKPMTTEEKLSQILMSQQRIEQRLSVIEGQQRGMAGMLRGPAGAGQDRPMPPREDPNKEYKIDVGNSSVKGDKNGKITLVEFSDFQCPYSQRFHPVMDEVLKAYPKGVKYILKNFPLPFHPNAVPAAKASFAAREQGKYWEMVDLLFKNGKELSEEKYKEFATQLGLDVEKFEKDLKDKNEKWEKLIQEDMEAVKAAAVGGTPTFFLNGKKVQVRDLNGFKTEIDAILSGKKDALPSGPQQPAGPKAQNPGGK